MNIQAYNIIKNKKFGLETYTLEVFTDEGTKSYEFMGVDGIILKAQELKIDLKRTEVRG